MAHLKQKMYLPFNLPQKRREKKEKEKQCSKVKIWKLSMNITFLLNKPLSIQKEWT